MPENRTLYLETTATADRIFGLPETIEALKQICRSNVLRHTFIRDAVVCHTYLVNSLEVGDSLSVALLRVRRAPEFRFRPRRANRAWDIVARLHDIPLLSLSDAIAQLEKDIRYSLRRLFFKGLQVPLLDTVACKRTDENPTEIPPSTTGGYARFTMRSACSKESPPDCNIVTFWTRNKGDLSMVAAMTLPTPIKRETRVELETMKAQAQKVLDAIDSDPSECHGEGCYAVLSDLVIALECPPAVPIVTRNSRHFAPLCGALSRPAPISYG
jgi:hypothetical protein